MLIYMEGKTKGDHGDFKARYPLWNTKKLTWRCPKFGGVLHPILWWFPDAYQCLWGERWQTIGWHATPIIGLLFSDKATSMLVDTAGSGAVWPTPGTVSEMLRGYTSRWYSWWDWVVWTSEIETKQQFGQSWGLAANRKVSYICQLGSLGSWEILGSMEGRRLPGLDPKPSISSKGERLDYDCQRGAAVAWLKASNQYIRCFP